MQLSERRLSVKNIGLMGYRLNIFIIDNQSLMIFRVDYFHKSCAFDKNPALIRLTYFTALADLLVGCSGFQAPASTAQKGACNSALRPA
jgi:hypothetical protein